MTASAATITVFAWEIVAKTTDSVISVVCRPLVTNSLARRVPDDTLEQPLHQTSEITSFSPLRCKEIPRLFLNFLKLILPHFDECALLLAQSSLHGKWQYHEWVHLPPELHHASASYFWSFYQNPQLRHILQKSLQGRWTQSASCSSNNSSS